MILINRVNQLKTSKLFHNLHYDYQILIKFKQYEVNFATMQPDCISDAQVA